jgi:hypothetical protein
MLTKPIYIAIFFSTQGIPAIVGLYTKEEFWARVVATDQTSWAYLINSETGLIVDSQLPNSPTLEKIS